MMVATGQRRKACKPFFLSRAAKDCRRGLKWQAHSMGVASCIRCYKNSDFNWHLVGSLVGGELRRHGLMFLSGKMHGPTSWAQPVRMKQDKVSGILLYGPLLRSSLSSWCITRSRILLANRQALGMLIGWRPAFGMERLIYLSSLQILDCMGTVHHQWLAVLLCSCRLWHLHAFVRWLSRVSLKEISYQQLIADPITLALTPHAWSRVCLIETWTRNPDHAQSCIWIWYHPAVRWYSSSCFWADVLGRHNRLLPWKGDGQAPWH